MSTRRVGRSARAAAFVAFAASLAACSRGDEQVATPSAAVERGHWWLAIIGVLTSVVSVFFYLRIVVMMYMTEGSDIVRPRVPLPAAAGLALATVAVFYLGILPTTVIELALDSISTIF